MKESINIRLAVERAVVSEVLYAASRAGWRACQTDMGDGPVQTRGVRAAMAEVFACDDGRVYLRHVQTGEGAWVYIVLGNDGWDCISDYSTNLTPIIEPIYKRIEERGFTVAINK